MRRTRWILGLGLLTLATSGAATAATLRVAMDGVDDPSCGSKTAPCRTITEAIENAKAGDRIRVAPGRYGDLNGYPIDVPEPGPVEGEEA